MLSYSETTGHVRYAELDSAKRAAAAHKLKRALNNIRVRYIRHGALSYDLGYASYFPHGYHRLRMVVASSTVCDHARRAKEMKAMRSLDR